MKKKIKPALAVRKVKNQWEVYHLPTDLKIVPFTTLPNNKKAMQDFCDYLLSGGFAWEKWKDAKKRPKWRMEAYHFKNEYRR